MIICPKCEYKIGAQYKEHYRIVLPIALPSQNQLGGNARGSGGWVYRGVKKKFLQAMQGPRPKAQPGIQYIGTITRLYGKRKRQFDLENLVGGCKPVIDAMRELGIILDDNPDVWRGYYRQERSPTEECASMIVVEYEA